MIVKFPVRPLAAAVCAAGLMPLPALATDGYFAHGYGMRAKGMAGVSYALAVDSFGGANNPASMVFVGAGLDVGIDWFSPQRSAERSGAAPGLNGSADSDSTNFFIPEFGYNYMLRPDLALGVSVYGNGGMNTDYPGNQLNCGMGPNTANLLCGAGRLGVSISRNSSSRRRWPGSPRRRTRWASPRCLPTSASPWRGCRPSTMRRASPSVIIWFS